MKESTDKKTVMVDDDYKYLGVLIGINKKNEKVEALKNSEDRVAWLRDILEADERKHEK